MRYGTAAIHLTRDQVRGALKIPSQHFLGRGFSREVLDHFDVGDSAKLRRAVVPLYDDEGTTCIGHTFRSIKSRCRESEKHHDPGTACRWGQQKWGINRGFPKRTYLYNLAAARASASSFVLLVEGPPDVWRVHEAGYVAVALLGADATEEQLHKLASLRRRILVAFDNDPPGEAARRRFRERHVDFPWEFLEVPKSDEDPGDTPTAVLREAIESR